MGCATEGWRRGDQVWGYGRRRGVIAGGVGCFTLTIGPCSHDLRAVGRTA